MEVNKGNQEEIEVVEEIGTPDITGMTITEAEKILKENDLTMQIENETEEMDKDNIIILEQTPKAGIRINKGNKIYIRY